MKRVLPIVMLLVVAIASLLWWLAHRDTTRTELELYGNIDLRQVELPFNGSERIAAVIAQEGDHVKRGQLLAQLDTKRLQPQVAQAEAQVAAQQQAVKRLHNGSRPEEIAQARANTAAAQADANEAQVQYQRLVSLAEKSNDSAVSRQDIDQAQAVAEASAAKLVVAKTVLALAVAGPRKEDIAVAEAQLHASEATLALWKQQLSDTDLIAPLDAVVRSRIVEPGEIATPQKTAFSLAITDPKWVRAYIGEADLGRVHSGMSATITVDAFPKRSFTGWVGFISPSAEFTPKAVQTEELRSSLVYEIRVFVKDTQDELLLGMPATVHLPLISNAGPMRQSNYRDNLR